MADLSAQKCATCGCGKPATMRCPTCKELGATDGESHFCSKECFKGFWEEHKLVHKRYKDVQAKLALLTQAQNQQRFADFKFSGKLRPSVVSPMMKVPAGILKPDYADDPHGTPHSELKARGNAVAVMTPEELVVMREACRIGRDVLDTAARHLKAGVTGEDIDKVVFDACVERGVYPSPLNYRTFPKSLCTSVNEVICHGIPDGRPLVDGDIINLDISIYHKGFHSDLNETYCVGNVDAKGRALVQCSHDCLAAAVALCKPGIMYRDVGTVIDRVAKAAGFSVVKSYTGHGVGRLFHCAPNIPHYKGNKAVGFMRAGHVFTIEPMINEGESQDMTWPDEWTSTTVDGKRSAQFEHTLLVTEDGVEILTSRVGASSSSMAWDPAANQAPFAQGEGPGEKGIGAPPHAA